MVKLDVVLGLLRSLESNLELLKPLRAEPLAALTSDLVRYNGMLHLLQLSVQHVTDIGAHLVAAAPLATPGDYKEVIMAMGLHGILPYEFAERIAPMAGFRNIIVHEYLTVDPTRVHDILQNRLGDFEEFVEYIYDYLRREGYLTDKEPHA